MSYPERHVHEELLNIVPQVRRRGAKLIGGTLRDEITRALSGSDMVFISTDWEEFRGLSRTIEQIVKPPYIIMDGRRMIPDFTELVARGYGYIAVGSPYLAPK